MTPKTPRFVLQNPHLDSGVGTLLIRICVRRFPFAVDFVEIGQPIPGIRVVKQFWLNERTTRLLTMKMRSTSMQLSQLRGVPGFHTRHVHEPLVVFRVAQMLAVGIEFVLLFRGQNVLLVDDREGVGSLLPGCQGLRSDTRDAMLS